MFSLTDHTAAPATTPGRTGRSGRSQSGTIEIGHQARTDILPAVVGSHHDELAICDDDREALAAVRGECTVPTYHDAAAMLAEQNLAFVVVVVPHHAGVRIAAERGLQCQAVIEGPHSPRVVGWRLGQVGEDGVSSGFWAVWRARYRACMVHAGPRRWPPTQRCLPANRSGREAPYWSAETIRSVVVTAALHLVQERRERLC